MSVVTPYRSASCIGSITTYAKSCLFIFRFFHVYTCASMCHRVGYGAARTTDMPRAPTYSQRKREMKISAISCGACSGDHASLGSIWSQAPSTLRPAFIRTCTWVCVVVLNIHSKYMLRVCILNKDEKARTCPISGNWIEP